MKKLICLMLATLLCGALAACNSEDTESSVDESSEESVEESVAPPPVPIINGNALTDYVIVYTDTAESATYRSVALELNEYFKSTFGIDLTLRSDAIPETEKEIIIGLTAKRKINEEYKGDYGYGGYKIAVNGNKLVIAGSYATGCYQGMKAFIEQIKASEDGVFNDSVVEGEGKVIKVACVGDSITQGINSTNPKTQTYPAYIQEMLGMEYYVLNAGLSGYSICKNDEYAYWKSKQYTQAKEMRPDVVIFHLGTNDANPSPNQPYKNWDDHDRESEFIESTKQLLDSFVTANKDVQTYVVLPASLFKVGADGWNAEAWTANIVKHSHPLLKQIAEEYNYPTIDMFDWSVENKAVFTDGLHPKDETYKVYAQYIYDNLKDTIKKP
ncbi:MAG: hypothetical protein IJB49_04825 [Clostridia bacterium]|nr:hypothetical protein [Clostridia bacterium]